MKCRSFFLAIPALLIAVPLLICVEADDSHIVPRKIDDRDGFLYSGERLSGPFLVKRANDLVGRDDPMFDRFCAIVQNFQRQLSARPLACPRTLTDVVGVRNLLPPPVFAADVPHLRMDIVLKRMEHIAISGGGVATDPDDFFDDLWASWLIQSNAAADQIPDLTDADTSDDNGYGQPVPQVSGEVWDNLDHANLLYSGIIANGCGSQTPFDVLLKSSIYRLDGTVLGEVEIPDVVMGSGYYLFSYTIRATDENGGVSDFVFSGEARVYCTGQSSI